MPTQQLGELLKGHPDALPERRVPSVDALIPALYLKGISTGDFSEALTAILGEGASCSGEVEPSLASARSRLSMAGNRSRMKAYFWAAALRSVSRAVRLRKLSKSAARRR